jgi:hypothetical protein
MTKLIFQNFKVNKEESFTAKEAINLLEGRAVKIEFNNPKTEQKETAFVKLDLAKEKTNTETMISSLSIKITV